MNGVTFSQNKDYIIIKIPKKQVVKGGVNLKEKELSEEQTLKLFIKGRHEFKQGKLKPIQDLAQLL